MLLPAESIAIVLQMIVDVGFVVGVMAPITPYGAYSVSVRPLSPVTACGVSVSVPEVLRVTSRFFMTLCSTLPRPVSRCACRASSSACSSIDSRIAVMICRLPSRVMPSSSRKATPAAATASSTVAKTPSPSAARGAAAGVLRAAGVVDASGTAPVRRWARRVAIISTCCSLRCSAPAPGRLISQTLPCGIFPYRRLPNCRRSP